MLRWDLQYFAKDGPGGEKTEEPTAKKLDDARKKGQVAKSKEVANATTLFMLFLVIKLYAGTIGTKLVACFQSIYGKIAECAKYQGDGQLLINVQHLVWSGIYQLTMIVLPIFLLGVVVAFVSDLVQVKWKPTREPMKPKLSKLNPISGLKKLFSIQSIVELVKSVLKIFLIVFTVFSYIKKKTMLLYVIYEMSIAQAIGLLGEVVVELGIRISGVYIIITLLDYKYTKWKFHEDMKMTKQEVKDEMKNAEGNPEIKGKIRSKMQEASRRRMMQAVPRADVVITNPTHFAVALKYDPEEKDAPYLLAKGEDYLAQKIKEVARENHIEIVENKPLARAIYHNVDVGAMIPPELYQAVAEVLTQVYKAQGKI